MEIIKIDFQWLNSKYYTSIYCCNTRNINNLCVINSLTEYIICYHWLNAFNENAIKMFTKFSNFAVLSVSSGESLSQKIKTCRWSHIFCSWALLLWCLLWFPNTFVVYSQTEEWFRFLPRYCITVIIVSLHTCWFQTLVILKKQLVVCLKILSSYSLDSCYEFWSLS